MGGKNMNAKIYLLEDINDNRYVGSTSEKILEHRLHTHRRDAKEYHLGIRKGCCSSHKLDLYYCSITLLKEVENKKDIRRIWESHYINNVYPECVNATRLRLDDKETGKLYYEKNKKKIINRVSNWRIDNREQYNTKRREWYHKNKDRINKQKREKTEMKRLANI